MSGMQDAAYGVQELIERLRNEGVDAGNQQAEAIVSEARAKASKIVDQARQQAAELVDNAYKQAEANKQAANEALAVAYRDAVIRLKEELASSFSDRVKNLVGMQLTDEEFLQKIILEVAGQARDSELLQSGEQVQLLLPEKVVSVEELRTKPEEVKQGTLAYFVLQLAHQLLRDGVLLGSSDEHASGIRLRLAGDGMELDLTDKAVAELLLAHLLPRFRALLEGIVHVES